MYRHRTEPQQQGIDKPSRDILEKGTEKHGWVDRVKQEDADSRKTQNTSINDSLNLTQKSKLKTGLVFRKYRQTFFTLFFQEQIEKL